MSLHLLLNQMAARDLDHAALQRATLLDNALASMMVERSQRMAAIETLKGRYQPDHPRLRDATVELSTLEGAIAERREQIAMLAEQIPAVQRVKDLTDHSTGENPFYS